MHAITRTTRPIRDWWATWVWWGMVAVVVFVIQVLFSALPLPPEELRDQPFGTLGGALIAASVTVGQQWQEVVSRIASTFGIVILGGFFLWKALSSLESRLDLVAERLEGLANVHDELESITQELRGIRARLAAEHGERNIEYFP